MTAFTRTADAPADVRPPRASAPGATSALRPRVVILGAGFAGLAAARALASAAVHVVVIDRRNHHLFQPLLYQVATAGLSPADIATPIRSILRDQANATVLLARVTAIDVVARVVATDVKPIPYDVLVVATGARHAYFGHDEWESVAPGLKKLEDAIAIRRQILHAFERAEASENEDERQRLLTFVVVGAGPTGVELAGAIAELAHRALARDFRRINPRAARVLLIEAGPGVLPSFGAGLADQAKRALETLGVEVRLGAAVTACDRTGVTIAGERIAAATVLWAAGVMASPAAKWLGAARDRAGRVIVGPDLTLPDHPEIFVLGDTALAHAADGTPLPGTAPVAKQQGQYAAHCIEARLQGKIMPPFRYRHLGSMATIGRKFAVADFGRVAVSGRLAWLLWGMVHVYFLIGFRNRITVLLNWLWSYLTFGRGARLITDPATRHAKGAPP
jgi:NADH:ubiquinone reductase (H+-translocating)